METKEEIKAKAEKAKAEKAKAEKAKAEKAKAEKKAKKIIDDATADSRKLDNFSKLKKEIVLACCHSAGSFHGLPRQKAISILETADQIIKNIKEGF